MTPQPTSAPARRLRIVQTLRGLAAFIVVWAHFIISNKNIHAGAFRLTAVNPTFGVYIFFVISGFILPYSLWQGGYGLRDYGRFVLKRVIRLDPPYFAAIAMALTLGYAATVSPEYRGARFSIDWEQLLLHVGFMNAFFHKHWIISVFWTLAIEFQYYIVLGLAYPLLKSNRTRFAGFVILCGVTSFLFRSNRLLPSYWPIFLMGIAVFRYKAGLAALRETIIWVAGFFAFGALSAPVSSAAAVFAAACILWLEYGNRLTDFVGTISYSLYLIHQPVGSRICNFGARFASNPLLAVGVAVVATLVSAGVAYVMFRWIELPSQKWAGRIRYRNQPARVLVAAATQG